MYVDEIVYISINELNVYIICAIFIFTYTKTFLLWGILIVKTVMQNSYLVHSIFDDALVTFSSCLGSSQNKISACFNIYTLITSRFRQ